jgi:putative oxidoreductase
MPPFSTRSTHPALARADGIATEWTDILLLVGRIFIGWLLFASGWHKFGNVDGTMAYFAGLGMSPAGFWAWFAIVAEFVLGAALILGVATRYAAIATFVWVLAATAIAHRYWNYPPAAQDGQFNHFLKNVAIMGGTLYVLAVGAGRYAFDAVLAKR